MGKTVPSELLYYGAGGLVPYWRAPWLREIKRLLKLPKILTLVSYFSHFQEIKRVMTNDRIDRPSQLLSVLSSHCCISVPIEQKQVCSALEFFIILLRRKPQCRSSGSSLINHDAFRAHLESGQ